MATSSRPRDRFSHLVRLTVGEKLTLRSGSTNEWLAATLPGNKIFSMLNSDALNGSVSLSGRCKGDVSIGLHSTDSPRLLKFTFFSKVSIAALLIHQTPIRGSLDVLEHVHPKANHCLGLLVNQTSKQSYSKRQVWSCTCAQPKDFTYNRLSPSQIFSREGFLSGFLICLFGRGQLSAPSTLYFFRSS